MQVGDLLHAEPAELAAAHGTRHVVAAAVVHLDDVSAAAWARLDVIGCGEETRDSGGISAVRAKDRPGESRYALKFSFSVQQNAFAARRGWCGFSSSQRR